MMTGDQVQRQFPSLWFQLVRFRCQQYRNQFMPEIFGETTVLLSPRQRPAALGNGPRCVKRGQSISPAEPSLVTDIRLPIIVKPRSGFQSVEQCRIDGAGSKLPGRVLDIAQMIVKEHRIVVLFVTVPNSALQYITYGFARVLFQPELRELIDLVQESCRPLPLEFLAVRAKKVFGVVFRQIVISNAFIDRSPGRFLGPLLD